MLQFLKIIMKSSQFSESSLAIVIQPQVPFKLPNHYEKIVNLFNFVRKLGISRSH